MDETSNLPLDLPADMRVPITSEDNAGHPTTTRLRGVAAFSGVDVKVARVVDEPAYGLHLRL
jgi:hypothetical protein